MGFLPPDWEAKARELGAFRRAKGFKEPRALLRGLLIHLALGCSLKETALRCQQEGIAEVSSVAVWKRLQHTGPWLQWLADEVLRGWIPQTPCDLFGDAFRVRLVDGTAISEPGSKGSDWRILRKAQRNGTAPKNKTLESAGYIFVATTTARESLAASNALEVYRGRWQGGLAFKRLKSLIGRCQYIFFDYIHRYESMAYSPARRHSRRRRRRAGSRSESIGPVLGCARLEQARAFQAFSFLATARLRWQAWPILRYTRHFKGCIPCNDSSCSSRCSSSLRRTGTPK